MRCIQPDQVALCDARRYERSAIEQWLAKFDTSPRTNEPLKSKELLPNIAVRCGGPDLADDANANGGSSEGSNSEFILTSIMAPKAAIHFCVMELLRWMVEKVFEK